MGSNLSVEEGDCLETGDGAKAMRPLSIKFYFFAIQTRVGNIIKSLSTCNFVDVQ